jgi:hypothetical protein
VFSLFYALKTHVEPVWAAKIRVVGVGNKRVETKILFSSKFIAKMKFNNIID